MNNIQRISFCEERNELILTIIGLTLTGILSAKTAGSKILAPTLRVIVGGCIGMAITAGIGQALHLSGI